MNDKLIHRDDLDPDVLADIQSRFPGMKIVCAGDAPEGALPPSVADALAALQKQHDESMVYGTCIDCGAVMPGYPPPEADVPADWKPVEGWSWFTNDATGEIFCWQCPDCDAKDDR